MMSPEGGQPAPSHDHGHESHGSKAKTDAMPAPRQDLDEPHGLKLNIPPAFAGEFGPVLTAYLKTQDALSHDKNKAAQDAAAELRKALAGVDISLLTGEAHVAWMKEADGMTKTATAITASADIQMARSAFALLSESMIVAAKCYGAAPETVHRFHCPMAFGDRGADWLQRKDKTENPYFGSAMFRCGVKKETIEQRKAGGEPDDRN